MLSMTSIPISDVAKDALGFNKKRDIIAPLEVCPSDHKICRDHNTSVSLNFSRVGKIPQGYIDDSPCLKSGLHKYKVGCKNCKEKLAEVYGKDKTLKTWAGLRYYSWHDKESWNGTRGVNIKDDVIKIECCCDPNKNKDISNYNVKEIK